MKLFTVGHSSRSLDDLIAVLRVHGIEELCDVRAYPGSRRFPQFARSSLEAALPGAGIRYAWFGKALGGHRPYARPDSPHTAIEEEGFRNYADHMESAEFVAAVDELLARSGPVALMCAERDPAHCHRSYLADYLVGVRGVEVIHIRDATETTAHVRSPLARVDGSRLVYDLGQRELF